MWTNGVGVRKRGHREWAVIVVVRSHKSKLRQDQQYVNGGDHPRKEERRSKIGRWKEAGWIQDVAEAKLTSDGLLSTKEGRDITLRECRYLSGAPESTEAQEILGSQWIDISQEF